MFTFRYVLAAVAVASAVGLAAPAAGSATPRQAEPPRPGMWCGVVPGTFVDTVTTDVEHATGGGAIEHVTSRTVFTASATGRSIVASGASTAKTTGPIDNGDGTYGFVTTDAGLVLKFQVLDGPVFKDANGNPIIGAGTLSFEDVFSSPVPSDQTYITTIDLGFNGPHPGRQGVDICTPTVSYLLGS